MILTSGIMLISLPQLPPAPAQPPLLLLQPQPAQARVVPPPPAPVPAPAQQPRFSRYGIIKIW